MSDPRTPQSASPRGRSLARAALLGNPSDGFGGKTLGLAFRELRADVSLGSGRCDADARRLVEAALTRGDGRPPGSPPSAAVTTQIPREVGLGGSSAIVIATLRAVRRRQGRDPDPADLARLALAVEREDLGIQAGPQDRVLQAHEGLLYMDFAESEAGRIERLDPRSLPPCSSPGGRTRDRHRDASMRTCAGAGSAGTARLEPCSRRSPSWPPRVALACATGAAASSAS